MPKSTIAPARAPKKMPWLRDGVLLSTLTETLESRTITAECLRSKDTLPRDPVTSVRARRTESLRMAVILPRNRVAAAILTESLDVPCSAATLYRASRMSARTASTARGVEKLTTTAAPTSEPLADGRDRSARSPIFAPSTAPVAGIGATHPGIRNTHNTARVHPLRVRKGTLPGNVRRPLRTAAQDGYSRNATHTRSLNLRSCLPDTTTS